MGNWANIINKLKEFAKYFVMPSAIIIFTPESAWGHLNVTIDPIYKTISLPVFLFTTSVIIIDFINSARAKRIVNSRLTGLTSEEKILLAVIADNGGTMNLNMQDGRVAKLHSLQIIRCSSLSRYLTWFDYFIEPWVIKYIKKHPRFLPEIGEKDIESARAGEEDFLYL